MITGKSQTERNTFSIITLEEELPHLEGSPVQQFTHTSFFISYHFLHNERMIDSTFYQGIRYVVHSKVSLIEF